jgi:hypothetical protein
VNPYAKIGIKVGVVILICIILLVAYQVVGHKAFTAQIKSINAELQTQQGVKAQLDALLAYKGDLPNIRYVQLKDMETIRAFMPPKEEFVLTGYLRVIHKMLADDHLDTNGILIAPERAAPGGTSFEENFSSDVTALAGELEGIMAALKMFQENKGQMKNFLVSYQFYRGMASGSENFAAIVGGIERHSFTLTVHGSYDNIKKFTFDIFNMRPHTALVNFQMSPQGPGIGPTRTYQASFILMTYADANAPPPLWTAYHNRGEEPVGMEPATGDETEPEPIGSEPAGASAGLPPVVEAPGPGPSTEPPVAPTAPAGETSDTTNNAGAAVGGKPESGGSDR